MNSNTIKCHYAYDGSTSPETWEITPIQQGTDYYINLCNLDRNFTETIQITKPMYEKIVLHQEPDMAEYLKTAYQNHALKGTQD